MLVTAIQPYKAKDKTDRWKVIFEGDDTPLILAEQPAFQKGAEIPKQTLRKIDKDTYSYYILAGETNNRSADQSASIEGQTVWKGLVEIFLADKMDEFERSTTPLVMGIRRYAERRLVQDHPYTKDALEGGER